MSAGTVSILSRSRASRASTTSRLPHWSEVADKPPRSRASPNVAVVLHDLVSWAADIAIVLTRECPEDRAAIERVRRYVYAWLAGDRCRDLEIDDVLTTVAALMAGIDRDLGGTAHDDDNEHQAIGAAVRS